MSNLFIKKNLELSVGVLVVVLLFVLTSFFAERYEKELALFVESGNHLSKMFYVLITVTATVFAPVSVMPLIPVASHLWGWFIAGLLSIIGWVIGAQIAFFLARKFGKPFVAKMVSLEKLNIFENYFSGKNLFWFVVFLRMILPVEILSYALGLFSNMKKREYFLATLIGVTPFAFIFAYTGELPIKSQIIIFTEILAVFVLIYIISLVLSRRNK